MPIYNWRYDKKFVLKFVKNHGHEYETVEI